MWLLLFLIVFVQYYYQLRSSPNELLILSSALVLGFYLRFEDDSVESAKNVKQWNVKIISVSTFTFHEVKFAIILVLN